MPEALVSTEKPQISRSGIEAVRKLPFGSTGFSGARSQPAKASLPEGCPDLHGNAPYTPPRPFLVTIGAYGWDAERFFAALVAAGVDTFCDVRARRGVRGREYAFANSQRLQARLAELGIRYLHRPDLAPSAETRAAQYAADKADHTAKRQRNLLSPAFVAAYRRERLTDFNSAAFVVSLGADAHVVALFCVERTPDACHRGLLAARLAHDLDTNVLHLLP